MRAVVVLALALAPALAGCLDDLYLPHAWGTATIAWRVDRRNDPSACDEHGTPFVHIAIRNDDDDLVAEDWRPCRDLFATYPLFRGWHRATLSLADENRAPRSRAEESHEFHVDIGRDVYVTVDLTPHEIGPSIAAATN